jgi:hypothetical protein
VALAAPDSRSAIGGRPPHGLPATSRSVLRCLASRENAELGPLGSGRHRGVVEARPDKPGAFNRPNESTRGGAAGIPADAADEMDRSPHLSGGPANPTDCPSRVSEHLPVAGCVEREIAHRHQNVEPPRHSAPRETGPVQRCQRIGSDGRQREVIPGLPSDPVRQPEQSLVTYRDVAYPSGLDVETKAVETLTTTAETDGSKRAPQVPLRAREGRHVPRDHLHVPAMSRLEELSHPPRANDSMSRPVIGGLQEDRAHSSPPQPVGGCNRMCPWPGVVDIDPRPQSLECRQTGTRRVASFPRPVPSPPAFLGGLPRVGRGGAMIPRRARRPGHSSEGTRIHRPRGRWRGGFDWNGRGHEQHQASQRSDDRAVPVDEGIRIRPQHPWKVREARPRNPLLNQLNPSGAERLGSAEGGGVRRLGGERAAGMAGGAPRRRRRSGPNRTLREPRGHTRLPDALA